MRKIVSIGICLLFLTGCATYQKKQPEKSFEEIVDIKLKQAIAIAETSLEVSKNAEKLAIESLNTSNQAKATSEKAFESANKAIEATNQVREFTQKEVEKAIDTANKAAKEAMDYADKTSQKAIEKANEAVEVANKASKEAIEAANKASERSIAVANQTLAEIGKLKATIKMAPEEEPIIEEEPKTARYYTIKKGDTLKKIAYKFYNDSSKWKLIYERNKKILKNPDKLTPGVKIVIP